jgi:hypothetical protein
VINNTHLHHSFTSFTPVVPEIFPTTLSIPPVNSVLPAIPVTTDAVQPETTQLPLPLSPNNPDTTPLVLTINTQKKQQYIIALVCNHQLPTSGVLDTGTPLSIMREQLFRLLTNVPLLPVTDVQLRSVTGDELVVIGKATIILTFINNVSVEQTFIVVRNMPTTSSILLGLDFCNDHVHKINCTTNTIQMKQQPDCAISFTPDTESSPSPPNRVYRVKLSEKLKIPARSSALVQAIVFSDSEEQSLQDLPPTMLFQPTPQYEKFSVSTLVPVIDQKLLVMIENPRYCSTKVKTGTVIGCVHSIREIVPIQDKRTKSFVIHNIETEDFPTQPTVEDEKITQNTLDKNVDASPLTDGQKQQLKSLLRRNIDIFGCPSKPLTRTDRMMHRIDTGNSSPIFVRQYRLSPMQRQEVDRNVNEMLKNNIITESLSPYSSPVLLVKKADGTMRFCIDFRRLNAITKKDVYPLPRIDETLDKLGSAKFYSTLDLQSGFWQIPLHPDDAEKTAFNTDNGHYQFLVLPFGLCNAPSTFQRMMNTVLMSHRKFCLVYIDDVIVFSPSFETHLHHLATVFNTLREANLTVKASKCNFGKLEVRYLGHLISSGTVKPDPSKLSAIMSFPAPTSLKQLQSFLGLIGYYRRFIPSMSTVAAPLYKLLRKEVVWNWSEEHQLSMKKLQEILTTTPVLRLPNFEKPFVLHTDASDCGLGAILSQVYTENDTAIECPISYASRSLSDSERNYSTTEKECLALKWAITHFRPYLIGSPFTVFTDHAALQWLMNHTDPSSKLIRMILFLQEYDFKIISRSGAANANADALSRLPGLLENKDATVHYVSAVTRSATNSLPPVRRSGMDPDLVLDPDAYDLEAAIQQSLRGEGKQQNKQQHIHEDSDAEEEEYSTDEENDNDDANTLIVDDPASDNEGIEQKYDSDIEMDELDQEIRPNTDSFRQAQRSDPNLDAYFTQAQQAHSPFTICNDLLYRIKPDDEEKESIQDGTYTHRLVIPESKKIELLNEYHDNVCAAHGGIYKTYSRLRRKYWWNGMKADVIRYVKSCFKCSIRKPYKQHQQIPIGSLPIPTQPFEAIALDVLGPLPITAKKNRYILVITDHFTRWPIAFPIKNQKTTTIATVLIEKVFLEYGFPSTLLSDRGSNFMSELMSSVLHIFRVKKLNTSAYHPQTNGLTERYNHTLAAQLTHYVNGNQSDWDEYLPYVVFAYRSAPHSTTGYSPYYLLFGREARFPIDSVIPIIDDIAFANTDEYVQKLVDRFKALHSTVVNQAEGLQQQKQKHNESLTNIPVYDIGSKVLMYTPKTDKTGQVKKLTPLWRGPYEVIDQYANRLNYKLLKLDKLGRRIPRAKPKIAHVGRMKPYIDRVPVPAKHILLILQRIIQSN